MLFRSPLPRSAPEGRQSCEGYEVLSPQKKNVGNGQISKGIAGVSMRLEPGVTRELHWHATAAEWAFVLEGRVRTTVVDPFGCSEINDFVNGLLRRSTVREL